MDRMVLGAQEARGRASGVAVPCGTIASVACDS